MARKVAEQRGRLSIFNLLLGFIVCVSLLIVISNFWYITESSSSWMEQSRSEQQKAERVREVGDGARNFILGALGIMGCVVAFVGRKVLLDRRVEVVDRSALRKEPRRARPKNEKANVSAITSTPVSADRGSRPDEIADLQRRLNGAQGRIRLLEQQLTAVNADCGHLRGQLAAERTRKDDEVPRLRREFAEERRRTADAQEEALKRQQEAHAKALEEAATELAALRAANNAAEQNLREAEQRVVELRQKIQDLEGRLGAIKKTKEQLFHQRNENLKELYELIVRVVSLLVPLRDAVAPEVQFPEAQRDPGLLKQLPSFLLVFKNIVDAAVSRLKEQQELTTQLQQLRSEGSELERSLLSVQAQLEYHLARAEAYQSFAVKIEDIRKFVVQISALAMLVVYPPKKWRNPETEIEQAIDEYDLRDAADRALIDLLEPQNVPAPLGDLSGLVPPEIEAVTERYVRSL